MNQALKTEAGQWSPPVELVSTSGCDVDESAAAVHDWIRRAHEWWRGTEDHGG